uniref:Cerebellar degeneration-related protein 2a n=1 Tax=Xiphophorus couchianus TaxID=32473 RepID=A0A3B5LNP8_9TELE
MLTDMILEEEFEKKGDSWYNQQDLEDDLHLAAELGKTLLDRNHDLEQALQQMYSTNQDQLQEIEYLTKQVELLRQMNDQHAKLYEQLDMAARDVEESNHRLVQDNRLAQTKINSLTDTIEALQTLLEDLQTQMDELKAAQAERNKRELAEQRRGFSAQSVSCLKELYDLQRDSDGLWSCLDPEEENQALQRSIQTLQRQIATEQSRREAVEREIEFTSRENRGLEQRLAELEGCWTRQTELVEEVEQLRARRPSQLLLPETVFFASEERQSKADETSEKEEEQTRRSRQRCHSDGVLKATNTDELRRGHEQLCIRRTEAVKQRGISLLNEVDAQYSALQVKYEELLQRYHNLTDGLIHNAVQSSSGSFATAWVRRRLSGSAATSDLKVLPEDGHQPEYKVLFKEIFTRIQKTKEDLSDDRHPARNNDSAE